MSNMPIPLPLSSRLARLPEQEISIELRYPGWCDPERVPLAVAVQDGSAYYVVRIGPARSGAYITSHFRADRSLWWVLRHAIYEACRLAM